MGPNTSVALDHLVELLGSTRELVGASAELMLDCWAVQSVEHAIRIGEAVRAFNLGWIEDMIYPENWDGYSQVRSALSEHRLAAG